MEIKALDNQKGYSKNSVYPQLPFTSYIVASKKSGKTTLLLNLLLNHYKGAFNKIMWVSPTASLYEKIDINEDPRFNYKEYEISFKN